MVLQIAQGVGYDWGVSRGSDISSWSELIKGLGSAAEGDRRAAVH